MPSQTSPAPADEAPLLLIHAYGLTGTRELPRLRLARPGTTPMRAAQEEWR
jgi:hypothetical protein